MDTCHNQVRIIYILLTLSLILVTPLKSDAEEAVKPSNTPSSTAGKALRAFGASAPNQDRFKAIRAAQVIAMANLLRIIQSKDPEHITEAFVQRETQRIHVQGTLVGATSCGAKYYADSGHAVACMEIKPDSFAFQALKDRLTAEGAH